MRVDEFYKTIKNNSITNELIIFKYDVDNFLAIQYINEIAKQHMLEVKITDVIEEISTTKSVFTTSNNTLQILEVDKFECADNRFLNVTDIIIICKTISKEAEKIYGNNIIALPKLEDWQVADYIYTQLNGMKPEILDELSKLCKNNAYRASVEIDRLKVFPQDDRDAMFYQFKADSIYSDLVSSNLFDFINAILRKDINRIGDLYRDVVNSEEPIKLVSLLYTNFRDIILIQCGKNPTAESCGLSSGQFWAKSKNIGFYTKDQLVKIFLSLTDLDRKLKTGEITNQLILDFILVDILGV